MSWSIILSYGDAISFWKNMKFINVTHMLMYSGRKHKLDRISAGRATAAEQDVAVHGRTVAIPGLFPVTTRSILQLRKWPTDWFPFHTTFKHFRVGGGCCLSLNITSRQKLQTILRFKARFCSLNKAGIAKTVFRK